MTTPGQAVEVLFVDDEKDNLTVIEKRIVREFRRLGCEVQIIFESDADAACDCISGRGSGKPFPVVMADLLFRAQSSGQAASDEEPRGIEVVAQARSACDRTVIVALTGGSKHQPGLERDAAEAGADIVLRRPQLLAIANQGGPQELVRRVHTLLCERDIITSGPALDIPEEPGMQSVVHDAGYPTLRLLLADIFTRQELQPARVALTYVTPGASGGRVIRAIATLTDGSHRQLLIKVGKDPEALRNEQQNYERYASMYDPALLVPYRGVAGPRNGWSALAMLFAPEVVTLRHWAADPTVAAMVPQVMDRLFLRGGLSAGYRDSMKSSPDGERPIRYLALPAFRRVLVRAAVEQLSPALFHPAGAAIEGPEAVIRVVEGFARDSRLGDVPASDTPHNLLLCIGHGDLHGGNILVSADHAMPVLVDLAEFGFHHWAGDVARLAVDLLMHGLDAGVESFFWRGFAGWREVGRLLGELDPSIDHARAENATVIAALRWFADHKYEVLQPLEEARRLWEWHIALAEQLLRRIYARDLPPAKRALALVAAHDQILAAATKMPPRDQTF